MIIRYINDNKRKVILETNSSTFPLPQVVVYPSEVKTFELDVKEDEVVIVKMGKEKTKVTIKTEKV